MTEAATVPDKIWVDESAHSLYRVLTEGADPVRAPFRTAKDMFLWAACLGYRLGQRRPLAGKRVSIFRFAAFTPQTALPLLKSIAIADTGDVDVLRDQDQMMAIVEEYANAGIHELRGAIADEHGQPLWNLVGLLR